MSARKKWAAVTNILWFRTKIEDKPAEKSKKQGKLGSCIGNSSNSYISVRGGLFIIFKKAKMKKNHSWSGDVGFFRCRKTKSSTSSLWIQI